jgi:LCP family protein required for cell wall assembly
VTILLVGVDNTHTRDLALTDTLMVASFDPLTQSLTMISIPRDISRLPFYSGGEWRPRINTLMQNAAREPERYPDGPMGSLVKQISYVVGVPIDYYAQIDIAGFTRLIDMVGGVDVVVERAVNDPGYQFSPDEVGFRVEPGPHHFDGKMATAFARSRRGSSDYDRARRQQQILLALRRKLEDPFVLANVGGLVDALGDMIRTDAPLERFPEIVSIAQRSQDAATRNIVLSPPKYAQSVFTDSGTRTFQLELKMPAIEELSIELFGEDSRYFDERHGERE